MVLTSVTLLPPSDVAAEVGVGATVVGAAVVGALVVGAAVVGALVVGAAVVGAAVVGVVRAAVVGVVGAAMVVGVRMVFDGTGIVGIGASADVVAVFDEGASVVTGLRVVAGRRRIVVAERCGAAAGAGVGAAVVGGTVMSETVVGGDRGRRHRGRGRGGERGRW